MDIEPSRTYIMKRSGERVLFDGEKIANAIRKANNEEGILSDQLTEEQIVSIVAGIERAARNASRDLSVEEIQDKVENSLMATGKFNVARLYITYRYKHNELRKMSNIDRKISSIVERDNEEVKQENSNKNPTILSVQRDYMAGEWSRYYTNRYLLPDDIVAAHNEGLIHFHDTDYFAQHMHNCCLVNLGDMLDNGTCISGTHIDTPRSFTTACTVASQIVAQVASSQYGGQTITMSHLARYVDVSRQKIAERLRTEFDKAGVVVEDAKFKEIVEDEVRRVVETGCQTIQYQLITLQSTNGQAPFVTIFMYLHEVPEGQIRDDLALIIEVMLRQRILGVKDNRGFYITPAFRS
jgi:ribonucleoside-triphosphate reductase